MIRKATITIFSILCLAILTIASTRPTFANTGNVIVVDTLNDTRAWQGDCSLRDAIHAANSNQVQDGCAAGMAGLDTIEFAPGLAGGTVSMNGSQSFSIVDDLLIRGDVTIDARYRSRIFLLANDNALTLEQLTLKHGKERFGGAVIVFRGDLTVVDVTFERNQATYSGGAISYRSGDIGRLNIRNSRFSHNSAEINGGAVRVADANAVIYNTEFNRNHAGERGGAIYAQQSVVSTSSSDYVQNFAEWGGAIYQLSGNIVVQADELTRNFARQMGGGMLVVDGQMRMSNSFLDTNESVIYGGGIAGVSDSSIRLTSTGLQGNHARSIGGGVYSEYSEWNIRNSVFSQNVAQQYGGGFYMKDSWAEMETVTILSNSAQRGGGIYNLGSDVYVGLNSQLIDNGADYGGALYNTSYGADTSSDTTLVDSLLTNNRAVHGAAIMNWVDSNIVGVSDVTVVSSQIENNDGTDGTAVFNHNAETLLIDNLIVGNMGNAINNVQGEVTLWASELHTNQYHNCIGDILIEFEYPNQDSDGSCSP